MKSTTIVILLVFCGVQFIATSGKLIDVLVDNADTNTDSNLLDTDNFTPQLDNCHEACLQKFSLDETTCFEAPICTECWETCKAMSSHRQPIAQNQWQLRIASMIKQEFLVATHLAWDPTNKLINCLVTWEVFGGGLMGNLLTDSANVELSLWPETKYRVQVTCKNKESGITEKSFPLTVDTSQAIKMKPESSSEGETMADNNAMSTTSRQSHDFNQYLPKRLLFANDADYTIVSLTLGICAAIILFILILICVSCRQPIISKQDDLMPPNSLLNDIVVIRS